MQQKSSQLHTSLFAISQLFPLIILTARKELENLQNSNTTQKKNQQKEIDN